LKKILLLLVAGILTVIISSCSATAALQKEEIDSVGYTLKNKKELMQQKVLNKKVKTAIVLP